MRPIERAALALQRAWDSHDAPDSLPPLTFTDDEGRYLARAVLQAIREPSDAMLPNPSEPETKLYAAARLMDDSSVDTATAANAIWQAMIDAALSE